MVNKNFSLISSLMVLISLSAFAQPYSYHNLGLVADHLAPSNVPLPLLEDGTVLLFTSVVKKESGRVPRYITKFDQARTGLTHPKQHKFVETGLCKSKGNVPTRDGASYEYHFYNKFENGTLDETPHSIIRGTIHIEDASGYQSCTETWSPPYSPKTQRLVTVIQTRTNTIDVPAYPTGTRKSVSGIERECTAYIEKSGVLTEIFTLTSGSFQHGSNQLLSHKCDFISGDTTRSKNNYALTFHVSSHTNDLLDDIAKSPIFDFSGVRLEGGTAVASKYHATLNKYFDRPIQLIGIPKVMEDGSIIASNRFETAIARPPDFLVESYRYISRGNRVVGVDSLGSKITETRHLTVPGPLQSKLSIEYSDGQIQDIDSDSLRPWVLLGLRNIPPLVYLTGPPNQIAYRRGRQLLGSDSCEELRFGGSSAHGVISPSASRWSDFYAKTTGATVDCQTGLEASIHDLNPRGEILLSFYDKTDYRHRYLAIAKPTQTIFIDWESEASWKFRVATVDLLGKPMKEGVLGNPKETNGPPPPYVHQQNSANPYSRYNDFQKTVLIRLTKIFRLSGLNIPIIDSTMMSYAERPQNSLVVRFGVVERDSLFSSGAEAVLGRAFDVTKNRQIRIIDRFNLRDSGEVIVFLRENLARENAERIGEITAHELAHGLGIRHINPTPGLTEETMDYEYISSATDVSRIQNSETEIVESPYSNLADQRIFYDIRHNPQCHLRRYVHHESAQDLISNISSNGQIEPIPCGGEYDDENKPILTSLFNVKGKIERSLFTQSVGQSSLVDIVVETSVDAGAVETLDGSTPELKAFTILDTVPMDIEFDIDITGHPDEVPRLYGKSVESDNFNLEFSPENSAMQGRILLHTSTDVTEVGQYEIEVTMNSSIDSKGVVTELPGCIGTCPVVPSCGDGVKSAVEQCDDGNTVDGDGCSSVCELSTIVGDIDGDGDVDRNDLYLVRAARNSDASGPNDLRDIDSDGRVTARDMRLLAKSCTRVRCAVN